ncbi:hypothetical protein Gotri_026380, partial [Gossypium trilobum]|nr:hypothetical protein [Gossypium trilobum]
IYKKIYEFSALCGGEILFIIFSSTGKPYSFSHPSVESITKHFSNASQPLQETTDSPIETYQICHWWKAPIDQLNLRELYKQDESFAVFNNLISLTRDKKIAPISLMQAPMDEDVPSAFPPRYGPNLQLFCTSMSTMLNVILWFYLLCLLGEQALRSPHGIHGHVSVACQHMVYGFYCTIPKP